MAIGEDLASVAQPKGPEQYHSELLEALGKDHFMDVYGRLKNDASVGRPEMVSIAHQFNGPVPPSTSRTKALERIYSRHRKLAEFR